MVREGHPKDLEHAGFNDRDPRSVPPSTNLRAKVAL